MSVLQLIFEYVPRWLAPTLMYAGVTTAVSFGWSSWNPEKGREHTLMLIGYAVAGIPAFREFDTVSVLILVAAGGFVEGAFTIRLYMKIQYFIANQELPPGSGLKQRTFYYLSIIFTILLIIWIGLFLIVTGRYGGSNLYNLSIVYTIGTVILSMIALGWKFRRSAIYFHSLEILGLIMLITGAEIFNLELAAPQIRTQFQIFNFIQAGDLVLYVLGKCGYAVGFWVGAIMYINRIRDPGIAVTTEA